MGFLGIPLALSPAYDFAFVGIMLTWLVKPPVNFVLVGVRVLFLLAPEILSHSCQQLGFFAPIHLSLSTFNHWL